jgi:outer membrane biosynthesis protein TonB
MTIPSNGITPEVIRGVMPPYRLSPDLLAATLAAFPAPPPGSTTAWLQTRVTRVVQEIADLKPADALQARMAAQLITTRELAHTFTLHAQAPNLEPIQRCRLGHTAAELLRSAAMLDRTLARHQQMPTPFFGDVIQDEVDIPALATIWASAIPAAASAATTAPTPPPATPPPATPPPATSRPAPQAPIPPVAPTDPPLNSPPAPQPDPEPTPPPAHAQPAQSPAPVPQPDRPPATPRTRPAGANWVIEHLDQGPGYTREILRPRTAADPKPKPAS